MAKFEKGNKANPAGRPVGSKDKRTELRQLLQPQAKDLLQKAVDLALDGDPQALRLCIDRLVPSLKATAEPVNAGLPTTGTLAEQGAAIFRAAALGEIGTDEATALMSILAGQVKIIELADIVGRIEALEREITT